MKKAFNRNLDKIRLPYRTVNMTAVSLSGSQTVINGGTPASLKKNKKDSSFCNQSDFKSEAAFFFFLLGKINVVLWPNLKL